MSRNHYPLNVTRLRAELDGQERPRCPGTGKVIFNNRQHAESARGLIRHTRRTPITPTGVDRCGDHFHLSARAGAAQKRRQGRR
jgi:hypothetical protein